jgi:hypothetical protein
MWLVLISLMPVQTYRQVASRTTFRGQTTESRHKIGLRSAASTGDPFIRTSGLPRCPYSFGHRHDWLVSRWPGARSRLQSCTVWTSACLLQGVPAAPAENLHGKIMIKRYPASAVGYLCFSGIATLIAAASCNSQTITTLAKFSEQMGGARYP